MKARFLYRAWKARWRDQKLEIAIARAFTTPGALVVDAGANKGAYLYWLRRFAGPNGKILAYEPQARLSEYLRRVCRAFAWPNVEVHSEALSNRAGTSWLNVPGEGVSPGASLEASVLDETPGRRFECKIDTLDQQLAGRGQLAFLKVDVEGHELALFEGARCRLEQDHPPVLFECEARHLTRHTMSDVFAFLHQLGYSGYLLAGHALLPVERFDPARHQARHTPQFWNEPAYFNNFLFTAEALPGVLQRYLHA